MSLNFSNSNIPNLTKSRTFIVIPVLLSLLFCFKVLAESSDKTVGMQVPFKYAMGNKKYQENCAVCHGQSLQGTKTGPPLLHPFYKPSHHADFTFYRAALKGVQAHHWEFGDMPPVAGITREDMDSIVPFIRWYQREKGLYKPD